MRHACASLSVIVWVVCQLQPLFQEAWLREIVCACENRTFAWGLDLCVVSISILVSSHPGREMDVKIDSNNAKHLCIQLHQGLHHTAALYLLFDLFILT